MKRVMLIAIVALAVVVAPVQAKGPKSPPPKPAPPTSKKCQTHTVSYEISGTLAGGSLTLNADGTYSGSLTVNVTKANKHAKADRHTTKAYTITNAKLKLHGANPAALAVNSRVNLEGTVTTLAKKCDHTGFTPTITILRGDLKAPKPHH